MELFTIGIGQVLPVFLFFLFHWAFFEVKADQVVTTQLQLMHLSTASATDSDQSLGIPITKPGSDG